MRVIAGAQKGRRLLGPSHGGLRPTPDRVREALFSIIGPRIVGACVVDLYAGTGAVGIEALSRGARHVDFVESDPQARKVLRANLDQCGFALLATVHPLSVAAFLRRHAASREPYDIVFADPPYRIDAGRDLLPSVVAGATIAADSLIILEHSSKATVPTCIGALRRLRQYRYGDSTLSTFALGVEGASTL